MSICDGKVVEAFDLFAVEGEYSHCELIESGRITYLPRCGSVRELILSQYVYSQLV